MFFINLADKKRIVGKNLTFVLRVTPQLIAFAECTDDYLSSFNMNPYAKDYFGNFLLFL